MSALAVYLVAVAACVAVVWAWWLTRPADTGEPEVTTATDRPCPKCGETMLDDTNGMTGAPYFCANGHRAVMYFSHPYESEGSDG